MKAKLCVTLLAIAIVRRARSETIQLPVYGSGASYYEHYEGNSKSGYPNLCNPWQDDYNRSQCFNLVEYLTVPVGIGNPVQMLNLTLAGGRPTYLCSRMGLSTLHARAALPVAARLKAAASFDPAVQRLSGDTCRDSGPGDVPKGVALMGSDDFKVGGKSARNVPFQVVKSVQSTLQSFWPSDGVFSTAIAWLGKSKSAVYQIASSVGQPQTTLYMKRTSGYPRGDRVGTFTLGGRDTKNCDGTWIDLPQGSEYWGTFNTKVNSVSLGSTVIYTNYSVAAPAIGSPTIGMPFSMFPLIGTTLNATFDPKTQFYVVPCDSVKDAPPLTFHMEGVDYVIPAGDYIRNLVPRSDNMCTVLTESLGVTEDWPNGQKVEEWTLGSPAMRSFCWNFHYDSSLVSVAKAIQDL